MVTEKDFLEAPEKYKGEWTNIFYDITEKYEEVIEKINKDISDEADRLSIIETTSDGKNLKKLIESLNELPEYCKQILIIGRTVYKNPKYIIILGPISERVWKECFYGIEI